MTWNITFLEEAQEDLRRLGGSVRIQVLKRTQKVSQDPPPATQDSYGRPLGNKNRINSTSLLKIKLHNLRTQVAHKVEITDSIMSIIIISTRIDEQVYEEAKTRRNKHHP